MVKLPAQIGLRRGNVIKILFLMPYFGRWPEWFFIFLETCRYNQTADWLFLTDCGAINEVPSNVRFVHMPFDEVSSLASHKLGFPVRLHTPYKLCDLKLAYGKIFEEFTDGYDYWGFGDVDVVYGNLREALTGEMLSHDIISFHRDHISGHLCLLKNIEMNRTLYSRIADFRASLSCDTYAMNDELLFPNGTPYSGMQKQIDEVSLKHLSIYRYESFNTPLSSSKPWIDRTFRFPSEWTWKNGQLTNDIDSDRAFPYLHFIHLKRLYWGDLKKVVYLDPMELHRGFTISCYGFHPIGRRTNEPEFLGLD